jgi:hypothetical protein
MEQEAAEIEEALHALLIESDLLAFENMIVFDMQLTQLEHFRHVSDEELMVCININAFEIKECFFSAQWALTSSN